MAQSSDELIKREIIDKVGGSQILKLRIFPQSSTDDQVLFSGGGLTFGQNGVSYGSCDAAWYTDAEWIDPYNLKTYARKPVIALEGTDALNRNSSGNAQYQRFHHALGAVKNGITGVYYLRKGSCKIQEDLFGMAYFASKIESGNYIITDDLEFIKKLIESYNTAKYDELINDELEAMYAKFNTKFSSKYKSSWEVFANARSTIIQGNVVIKYAGRMRRNFTDSSQRAGHISVGEMYLTKYYFYNKQMIYLFPKMTSKDLAILDKSKSVDKEWHLLRHEPNVTIKTLDDIKGLDQSIYRNLISIADMPLKGEALRIYSENLKVIVEGIKSGKYTVKL